MFSTIEELYFIKPGQKLALSQHENTEADIYAEAVNMDTVLEIRTHLDGHYVVLVQNEVRVSNLATTLVKSGLETATMTIPEGMNRNSLKSAMYQTMQVLGKHYKMSINEDKISIVKKEKNDIVNKIESLPVGEKVTIKSDNPLSTKIMVYRHAKKIGATVKIKLNSDGVDVIAIEKKNIDGKDYYKAFKEWVSSLPYNRPTPIPQNLRRTDEAYIRTCISKTRLDIELKNGILWRKKCCLKKKQGVTHLKYCDEILYSFESTSSYVKTEHIKKINLLLKPHGITYEDIK